jgi:hypothetical protein
MIELLPFRGSQKISINGSWRNLVTSPAPVPGTVQNAPAGLRGVDTVTKLDPAKLALIKTSTDPKISSAKFIGRYVGHTVDGTGSVNLDRNEVSQILLAGYALTVLMRANPNPNSGNQGTSDGNVTAQNAKAAGIPTGNDGTAIGILSAMELFLDVELAPNTPITSATLRSYCQNWSAQVSNAGYAPALYLGAGTPFTANDLAFLQSYFVRFWSAGNINEPGRPLAPPCGYAVVQEQPFNQPVSPGPGSFSVDYDFTQADNAGRTPIMLFPAAS